MNERSSARGAKAREREDRRSQIFWAKMLHGGALDYGSSKQPTTTLAALARGIRCVSTSKVGSTPSFAPKLFTASVALMQSKRFLPARLLVQVQPGAPVGRQRSPMQTTSCPALFETADAEVPMPGNNWDPGRATFSRCGLTVRHGVWDAGTGGSIPLTSTRNNGHREPGRRSRSIAVATMRRRAVFQLGV